ncbi:hypothetical protein ACYBSK_36795 [Streptomyces sp. BYX5S]
MAILDERMMRRTINRLGQFTGPLLIIMISGSSGVVIGVALASRASSF